MAKTNTWTLMTLISVFTLSGALVACGSKTSDGGSTSYTTTSGLVQVCTATGCTYQLPTNYKAGAYAQSANFYIPGYANNGTSFQTRSGMYQVLKEAMGVCDRNTYSGGYAGCQQWVDGAHDMIIYLDGQAASQAQSVKFIIRSTPGVTYGYSYTYSFPSFQGFIMNLLGFSGSANNAGVFDPMVLDATIWPINNSKGIELRATGPRMSTAWNKLFQLQVLEGKLEDASWNYKLHFDGKLAAEGKGAICQSQYCGMESSYFNNSSYYGY